jgi:hypothetical protein
MRSGPPLLGGALSPAFERRVVVLGPGGRHTYRPDEWRDALVSVDSGEIELECAGQPPRAFRRGDLLCLADLELIAIHNSGPEPAVLTAVSRRPH